MPILTCTKCAAGLRVPDGATGAARCPRCKALIPVEDGVVSGSKESPPVPPPDAGIPNLALEPANPPPPPPKPIVTARPVVVAMPAKPPTGTAPVLKRGDEPTETVPAARPLVGGRPPAAPPRPPKKPAFEVVDDAPEPLPFDDPPPRGRADDRGRRDDFDDEYDDRPRRPRYDDDYDDRPRARRRDDYDDDRPRRRGRRDDYDDEYDDRPRRGRGRYEDDYDDYEDDYRRPRGRSDGMGAAKVGTLLVSISLWIYLGTYGLLSFLVLLAVLEAGTGAFDVIATIGGIIGLGNWTVALVGVGFLIAGPARYGLKGLSIAAAIVGGIHLVLMILTAFGVTGGRTRGGFGDFSGGVPGHLGTAATLSWLLDLFPTMLYISSKTQGMFGEVFSHTVVPLLAAICEVARLILLMLIVKAAARIGKDSGAATRSQVSVIIYSVISGVIPVIILLIVVIMAETAGSGSGRPRGGGGGEGMLTAMKIAGVLIALAHTCALIMPGVAANEARAAVARRAR